jgi:hypothetical protein
LVISNDVDLARQKNHPQTLNCVGLVAINVQQPLTIAAAAAGVAPTMCTHPRCQRLAATIVEEELELAATFVEEELELVAPFLPINRQQESRAN